MKKIRFRENAPKLPELCRTVKEICDALPSLEVYGDNKTTFVKGYNGGKIITAKPQQSNGVGGSVEGSTSTYNGMWAFSDYYNESGIRYLRIKSGIYNRNGYFIKMNGTDNSGYYDILWSNFTARTQTYYIWIYQKWDYYSKTWLEPQIRWIANNVMAMPEQDSPNLSGNTVIEGWCLLGWVQPDHEKQWTCMETNIPIMIAAGNCMYSNLGDMP